MTISVGFHGVTAFFTFYQNPHNTAKKSSFSAAIDDRFTIPLHSMTSNMWGQWRDHRLNVDKVATSTVNRDFNLISNVYTVARREWKWICTNPTTDVRRPKNTELRDKRIPLDEIDRITLASGFNELKVSQVKHRVGIAFLFAIETAMRAGEICSLTNAKVNMQVASLTDTKTVLAETCSYRRERSSCFPFFQDGNAMNRCLD